MSEITKLKPMTLAEYSEVVAFVQKYFPFGWVDDEDRFKNSKGESVTGMIKYITNSYDTREGGEIWQITFNYQICFSDKVNFKKEFMKYHGRKKPYSEQEIVKIPCVRCGNPSVHQWQACANKNNYVAICLDCDILLNRMALEFMKFPNASELLDKYEKEQKGL